MICTREVWPKPDDDASLRAGEVLGRYDDLMVTKGPWNSQGKMAIQLRVYSAWASFVYSGALHAVRVQAGRERHKP